MKRLFAMVQSSPKGRSAAARQSSSSISEAAEARASVPLRIRRIIVLTRSGVVRPLRAVAYDGRISPPWSTSRSEVMGRYSNGAASQKLGSEAPS